MRAWKKALCKTGQNRAQQHRTQQHNTRQYNTLQNSADTVTMQHKTLQALFCADWQKYTTFHYINSAVQNKTGKDKTLQAFLRDL